MGKTYYIELLNDFGSFNGSFHGLIMVNQRVKQIKIYQLSTVIYVRYDL